MVLLTLFLIAQGLMIAFLAGFIHAEHKKTRSDIQQVKTSQRASQKRERKLLKEVRK